MKSYQYLLLGVVLLFLLHPSVFDWNNEDTTKEVVPSKQQLPISHQQKQHAPIAGKYVLLEADQEYHLTLDSGSTYIYTLHNLQTGQKTKGQWEVSLSPSKENVVILQPTTARAGIFQLVTSAQQKRLTVTAIGLQDEQQGVYQRLPSKKNKQLLVSNE